MTAEGFLRDGYTLLEGFLAVDEVAAARAEVDQLLAQPRDPSCERPANTLVPLRFATPLVARILTSDAKADRVAAAAGGDDLRWISGYVSVKDPHSGPLDWHQDWWCWDHPVSHRPQPPQIALLVYLTDTSSGNAALRVRPGSHRGAGHAAEPLALPLTAGDAALIDYRLLHATHANTTKTRRDCVILNYAPAWAALPPDIRGHLIQHPALPHEGEPRPGWADARLPRYDGPRADLSLNRTPPVASL